MVERAYKTVNIGGDERAIAIGPDGHPTTVPVGGVDVSVGIGDVVQPETLITNTTTEVIDDMEDGDTTVKAANWSGWTIGDFDGSGDTFTATTTALVGSYSMKACDTGGGAASQATRDTYTEIRALRCYVSFDDDPPDVDDDYNIAVRSGTIAGPYIVFDNDQVIRDDKTTEGGSQIKNGTWSVGTTYKVEFTAISYSDESFNLTVTRTSDGTVILQADGIGFRNGLVEANNVRFTANTSGTELCLRWDEVSVDVPA